MCEPSSSASTTADNLAAATPALGRKAASGILWTSALHACAQLFVIGAQVVLGLLLTKDDFGIYALATSSSMLILVLRGGGMQRILVQDPERFNERITSAFLIATIFNLVAAALLVLCAPLIAQFYSTPELSFMLFLIGLELVISSPTIIYRSQLMNRMRFRSISFIDGGTTALRSILMIVFALRGMGPLSFVLPSPIVAVVQTIMYHRCSSGALLGKPIARDSIRRLLRDSGWVVLGSLALALITQSDYLVVGRLESTEFLGVYFFGFSLIAATSRLLSRGLSQVLMPVLSKMSHEPERQGKAFIRVATVLIYCFAVIGFGIAVMSPPLIRIVWQGKWDESIPVVILLSVGLPILMFSPVSTSLLESHGQWKFIAIVNLLQGIMIGVAAAVAVSVGGMKLLVIGILLVHAFFMVIKTLRGCHSVALKGSRLVTQTLPPTLTLGACAAAVSLIHWIPGLSEPIKFVVGLVFYALLVVAVTRLMYAEIFNQVRDLIRPRSHN